eukprot:5852639-Amphidinium_carterae.1
MPSSCYKKQSTKFLVATSSFLHEATIPLSLVWAFQDRLHASLKPFAHRERTTAVRHSVQEPA